MNSDSERVEFEPGVWFETFQPGPIERKWTERLRAKLTGRWSHRVVNERLASHDRRRFEFEKRFQAARFARAKGAHDA